MGNDVVCWRASIGLFYCKTRAISKRFVKTLHFSTCIYELLSEINLNITLSTMGILFILSCKTANVHYILYLMTLLLLSGDIEPNPGPDSSSSETTLGAISIMHLNIRSLRNKLNFVFDNFCDFDILCFTETHLNDQIDDNHLTGECTNFNLYRRDVSSHSGGVVIYVNNSYYAKRRFDLEILSVQCIWLEVSYQRSSFLLCAAYRPPNSPTHIWDDLNISIERALETNENVILLGDLNDNLLNENFSKLKNIILINNLTNVITEPTRISQNSYSLLDPIIASNNINVCSSGCIDIEPNISDHRATYVYIKFAFKRLSCSTKKVWLYNRGDFNRLNDLIQTEDWSFIEHLNINDACANFTTTLIRLMTACIPSKEIVIRPNDKPWFDSTIRKFIRHRDRQKKIAIKKCTQNAWLKYKHLRNKVNNLKKFAKKNFFENIESNIEQNILNNNHSYWKSLKNLINNFKETEAIPTLRKTFNGVDQFFFTDEEKANCLNDYFSSVSSLDDSNTQLPPFIPKTNCVLDNITIERSDIEHLIGNLDPNKAVGSDGISHKLLKQIKFTISSPLFKLFNKSLQVGIYPNSWKVALVLPLFKKGERNSPCNYRPISLLSCLGKLMERCVYKHLYNYLTSNNLIYSNQSGFLTGHSTVYQLIEMYHQLVQSFDNKTHTCLVFCDISKAFDRVWHSGLLFKIRQLGIKGQLLCWIRNYLINRQQQVTIGQSRSRINLINAGVPQGSVLGPLLFLIYVNDITENLVSMPRLFADDTSLACTTANISDLEGILNHDLNVIANWSKQWLVKFNPSKTEVIYFGHGRSPSLLFENSTLTPVNTHKHLGITLSNNYKWTDHVNNILTTSSKLLGIMRRIKFTVSRKALNQIYISYLRPILEYASPVWDNCTQNDKDKLERVQLEAARIVTGTTRSISSQNLYRETGWLTLSDRRQYQKLILMYKIKHSMVPNYLSSLFPRSSDNPSQYTLRSRNEFLNYQRRTTTYANSFVPSSINEWNNLPEHLRNSPSISCFKQNLQKFKFSTYQVPTHFLYGTRFLSTVHTRLRNNCSNLKNDLYNNHISNTDRCDYCNSTENAEHYFFQCNKYTDQRYNLFSATRNFHPLNTNKLLFGDNNLSLEQNIVIVEAVHQYIRSTKRFES